MQLRLPWCVERMWIAFERKRASLDIFHPSPSDDNLSLKWRERGNETHRIFHFSNNLTSSRHFLIAEAVPLRPKIKTHYSFVGEKKIVDMDLINFIHSIHVASTNPTSMLIKTRVYLSRVFVKSFAHLGASLGVIFLTSFLHKANWLSIENNCSSRNFKIVRKICGSHANELDNINVTWTSRRLCLHAFNWSP